MQLISPIVGMLNHFHLKLVAYVNPYYSFYVPLMEG
jgi:hypothetical protein